MPYIRYESVLYHSNSLYQTSLFALLAGFHRVTQMPPGDLTRMLCHRESERRVHRVGKACGTPVPPPKGPGIWTTLGCLHHQDTQLLVAFLSLGGNR